MNKVELEFKRIQTYLFASPRLRAMLGANAALGSTIRIILSRLARECGASADPGTLQHMPTADAQDPLQRIQPFVRHTILDAEDHVLLADDPQALYRNFGVLVRDGGHFIATFPEEAQARAFIERATARVTEELPGILLEARLNGEKYAITATGESLFQHPGFQVSHHLGNKPAERRGAKNAFVSAEEMQMEERGRRFREDPGDLIGLLEQARAIPCADEPLQSLAEVAGEGYLALIHADGNGMGQRYQAWRAQGSQQGLASEAHGERFYHSMRVAVRSALTEALAQTFKDAPERYQLLMLGGDDLLLACAASHALPFVCAYTEALAKRRLCDQQPLSVGVGVAIARQSFPFHRLHATAEALADSAKQLYRAHPELGSVVDWHITTNAWMENPLAERRADSLAGQAVLSGKPYPVLGARGLSALLAQSAQLSQTSSQVARSQLRQLVEVMRQGPALAELAWEELPKTMGATLRHTLTAFGQSGPFKALDNDVRLSILPDLVELLEIQRKSQPEAAKEVTA